MNIVEHDSMIRTVPLDSAWTTFDEHCCVTVRKGGRRRAYLENGPFSARRHWPATENIKCSSPIRLANQIFLDGFVVSGNILFE
jgi:hypothetical protein